MYSYAKRDFSLSFFGRSRSAFSSVRTPFSLQSCFRSSVIVLNPILCSVIFALVTFAMPSRGRKFISEFLLPNLNSKRFGTRLMWLNVEHSIFQVQWNHKSASGWTTDDAEVFMEWDKIKGRCMPDDKDCYTKSKQRFRAIIYKLIKARHITEICCSDKCTKIYCFGTKENIPSDVIALNSRGSSICEILSEKIYSCDLEAVMDVKEISEKSFLRDNQVHIIEDHKYAVLRQEAILESEVMVPDCHLTDFNFWETPYLYVDVISENLSQKQGLFPVLEDSYLQNSNDCTLINISNCVKWEDLENYESIPEENPSLPERLLYSEKI